MLMSVLFYFLNAGCFVGDNLTGALHVL